jgi:hypothetical protein
VPATVCVWFRSADDLIARVEHHHTQQIDAALDSNPEKEVWECWVESIVRNGDSHKWERYGPITHASQSGRIIQVRVEAARCARPLRFRSA